MIKTLAPPCRILSENGLLDRLLDRLFPLHFAVDQESLHLTRLGPALKKLLAGAHEGDPLGDWISFVRPQEDPGTEDIRQTLNQVYILRTRELGATLRGQILALEEQELFLFAGSLWLIPQTSLTDFGLTLRDLAIHDPAPDLQHLFQTQQSALAETRDMAKKLGERNKQLKRSNTELEHANLQLELKNAELDRYAYTVSHDLKSPLVTIKGFLGLLQKDARSGDWEHLDRDIELISRAADQMTTLLGDLLELSRIGRVVNSPLFIPLGELAAEAVEATRGSIDEREVEVEIQENLPEIYGDRQRLLEVLQNLIENAVKFMGDQPEPRIVIEAAREKDRVVVGVNDNGAGIAAAYLDKVFGLFERLNPDIEGTGVGLALVKRIVEFHGGRIWAESPGLLKGSTFRFSLPYPA